MSVDEARGTGTEIVQEKPSSSSTQASPSKVPASLASKTKDELAELLVSTLRQLKARDQKLKELNEVRATTDAGRQERHDAELAALKDRILVVEKEYAELVRRREEETKQREEETKQREEETKQREASAEELSGLRKSQAKLKKAVVELRKRNESLDKRHGEIDAARCAAVDELRKAEAQIAAFAEYKQKAHALLKAKDEEIKNGSMEIREGLEAELNAEKAARKKAELARDAAAEELGKVQSQAAAQIHEVEMQHKDRLAQLQKELELQASHAKNSAKRLQQLQVRYDSAQQRYESLKNSSMNGGDQRRDSAEPPARATSVDGSDAESTVRLDAALEALDRAKAEASAATQINRVLEQEVSSLKATVDQLRMTLTMKKSIKMPFRDHQSDRMPPSPFSPAHEGDGNEGHTEMAAATSSSWQERLSMAERKASLAEREVDDLELEITLREAQEKALKSTIRELEGEIHRLKMAFSSDGVDMEYLKNILVQVFKGAQDELSLLQVVAKILSLSEAEVRQCSDAITARKAQAEAGLIPDLSSLIPSSFLS